MAIIDRPITTCPPISTRRRPNIVPSGPVKNAVMPQVVAVTDNR